ncbi:unnamed protein product [Caenorhabditis nigoni]
MSSLSEMPKLVMENIIGFLDFRSVLTLRQVCRDFLNFIDRLNDSILPDSEFSRLELIVNEDILLNYVDLDDYEHNFIYSKRENSRSFNGKTKNLGNSNIMDVAVRDLELLLKFQKSSLKSLFLHWDPLFETLPVKLGNILKNLDRKIKTKVLCIKSNSQSEIMLILSFIDPETLNQIDLFPLDGSIEMGIKEIVTTEQWKKANGIHINFYVSNFKIEDACHFSRLILKTHSIFTFGDLDFLKETLINSSKFEFYWLTFINFEDIEEIPNYWGPAFNVDSDNYWYFEMRDSEELILRIKINHQNSEIYFDAYDIRCVPAEAVVQDYIEY